MKRVLCLLFGLLVIVSAFCGCTDDVSDIEVTAVVDTEPVELSTTEVATTEVETTATSVAETTAVVETKAPTPEAKPKQTVPAWKSAYINYIEGRGNTKSNCDYRLVYVDSDSIPELFISGSCEAEGSTICTYSGGRVVAEQMSRIGGAYYIPKSGLVYNCNGNSGYYRTVVYRLSNGKFTQLFEGLNTVDAQEIMNENGEYEYIPVSKYFLYDASGNEYEVTEEEYLNASGKYFNTANSEALYRYNDSSMSKYPYIKQQINIW